MTGERITTVLNLSCLYAVIWGLFIIWPTTDTFATQPKLWEPMREMAREEYWGAWFVVSGVAAYAIALRYAWIGSFVMFAMFFSIAVLFFLGDLERPGWALIGMLALFNFLQGRARWKASRRG